jgi:amidohydrolase
MRYAFLRRSMMKSTTTKPTDYSIDPEYRLDDPLKQLMPELLERLSTIRQHLHKNPELSEAEFETTAFLAEQVDRLDLSAKLAGDRRGLSVDFGAAERRIGVRGDIDALPILESSEQAYQSQVEGVMHACGHDAHAAMTFGALLLIKQLSEMDALPYPVSMRAIFQPAEETSTGGQHMIEHGALDDLDAIVALHVDPTRSTGTIGVRHGSFTAGCDLFYVEMNGDAGHSARPHLTGDALAAAISWIEQAHTRIPRCHDSREPIVLNVGQIQSGSAINVVPQRAQLSGTLRCVTTSGQQQAVKMLEKISQAVGLTHAVQVKLTFGQHTPPVINHTVVTDAIERSAIEWLGCKNVEQIELPSMGAEDFSFMTSHLPGAMFRLGISNASIGNRPLHTNSFDIDENALTIGAVILAKSVIRLCSPNRTI